MPAVTASAKGEVRLPNVELRVNQIVPRGINAILQPACASVVALTEGTLIRMDGEAPYSALRDWHVLTRPRLTLGVF